MALSFPGGKGPQLIVDDGGDATLLIHKGYKAENDASTLDYEPSSYEEEVILGTLRTILAEDKDKWHRTVAEWKGVSEETTTGVHRLYQMQEPASCSSRPSMSTTPAPSRSSTISTAAASRWPTVSSAPRT